MYADEEHFFLHAALSPCCSGESHPSTIVAEGHRIGHQVKAALITTNARVEHMIVHLQPAGAVAKPSLTTSDDASVPISQRQCPSSPGERCRNKESSPAE